MITRLYAYLGTCTDIGIGIAELAQVLCATVRPGIGGIGSIICKSIVITTL